EQFLSNMSHELRTPLHSLISLTNLLGETMLDHEQIEYVQNMRHSCEVLLKMVDNLLDLNQLETGRLTFSREAFSFHHLIEKVCGIFKLKAEEKGLEILIFNDVSIPDYLIGDSFRLKQILLYLIENAINFTERGAITISTRMVKMSPRNVEVEFSVCDTGVGISPKKMEQMFEKFNQALILNQRSYGGPGLGLTIAKKLIELQGGSITLKSSERKGTEVLFKIKYAVGNIAPAKSITSERITNVASKKPLENMKVLIAEDVDINRLVIGKHMQKLGYQFDFAENGKIAFEKVRDNHYDIVLMDMQMPVMDGYEAIRLIRNELPPEKAAVPIISVTASVLGDAPQKCREAGADDYVPKPYSVADLQHKMEKLVANGKDVKQPVINERKDVMAEKLTNLEYLEQMADGDNEFIESMISYFITNAPVSIEDMKTNLNQGNWEILRHVAHKYKPQLNFMGIQSILEDVETIEQNANKVQDTDKIPALLQKVERVTFQAIEELKNLKLK
ncbi:MAG: response regulator, partial [Bacteroidales bacterium]|nr:response regulator [Bacteroidales bacterium]